MGPTGPTSSWRPFGPAFGPSGLLTHYPTANTLSECQHYPTANTLSKC